MSRKLFILIETIFLAIMGGVLVANAAASPRSAASFAAGITAAPGNSKPTSAPMTQANSGFTYQGRLNIGGTSANGQYDLVFTLFNAPSGGNSVGTVVTATDQTITDGLFSTTLDFGPGAFQGDARWLEVAVRPSGTGSFTTLSPRQAVTAAPYALSLVPGAAITSTLAAPLLTLSNTLGAGIYSQSASNNGVTGISNNPGTSGLYGENFSAGYGVAARNNSNNLAVAAIYGENVLTGTGVYGYGGGYGVIGGSNSGGGLYGFSTTGRGVYGLSSSSYGVYGTSTTGVGVYGNSSSNIAVYGNSSSGTAVYGVTSNTLASGLGAIYGVNSSSGYAVKGNSASGYGVYGTSTNGEGVSGVSTNNNGIHGRTGNTNYAGTVGDNSGSGDGVFGQSANGIGIHGNTLGFTATSIGVYGQSSGSGPAVKGSSTVGVAGYFTSTNNFGVYGATQNIYDAGVQGVNTSGHGYGVYANGGTIDGIGVYGTAGGAGIYGNSTGGNGVEGHTTNGIASGVYGDNFAGGYGIAGRSNVTGTAIFADNSNGTAGYFRGNVTVQGSLSKGAGSFKIDHPLDPANKYLYHSFVESPDMMNIYNGNVTLDDKGEATVELPAWFDALNKEYRYQLTALGAPGPNLYVAQEITGNHFKIAGGKAGMKVSWQVTGIRHDPYAEEHRIPVEENKSGSDKGKYLYPDAYGKPDSLGIGYDKAQQLTEQNTQHNR